MPHLKRSASGHLLHNAAGHLATSCGGGTDPCSDCTTLSQDAITASTNGADCCDVPVSHVYTYSATGTSSLIPYGDYCWWKWVFDNGTEYNEIFIRKFSNGKWGYVINTQGTDCGPGSPQYYWPQMDDGPACVGGKLAGTINLPAGPEYAFFIGCDTTSVTLVIG